MVLILSRSDIQRCLKTEEAIATMRVAFSALHAAQAEMPQRLAINLPEQSVALLMPSLLNTNERHIFVLKLITVILALFGAGTQAPLQSFIAGLIDLKKAEAIRL